jgi:hypothetical protein
MANTFPSSGNTGIGTASPSYLLDLYTGTQSDGIRITSTTSKPMLRFSSTAADSSNRNWEMSPNGQIYGDFEIAQSAAKDGDAAGGDRNVRFYIKNDGNIGIGTTSPGFLLDVIGSGGDQSGAGQTTQIKSTNGTSGQGTGIRISSVGGSKETVGILSVENTSGTNGDMVFRLYNGGATMNEKVRITASGSVGINTSSPGTYKLNVNGTFYSAGSSLEYKTDITTLNTDTNKILELRPVTYQYKDEYKHLGKELKSGTQIGLIAEEVAEVFPELAMMKEDEDGETRVRNVDYEKLSILLLSEVQKLRKEVNELKNK